VARHGEMIVSYPLITRPGLSQVQNNVTQGDKVAPIEFPLYGLSLCYTLTVEQHSEQNRVSLTVPISTPVVYANQQESL